jgi:prophage maintenance system killer protein
LIAAGFALARSPVVFLRLNGFHHAADSDDWERLVLDVASGKIDREQTTRRLRKLVRKVT